MPLLWQQIIVAALVAACAAHLAYRAWQVVRGRKSGCGSCGTCPSNGKATGEVISLDALRQSVRRD